MAGAAARPLNLGALNVLSELPLGGRSSVQVPISQGCAPGSSVSPMRFQWQRPARTGDLFLSDRASTGVTITGSATWTGSAIPARFAPRIRRRPAR